MVEVLTISEVKVLALYNKYSFSSTYHVHAFRIEDRVTSNPLNHVVVYEEFLLVGLRFPLHPFVMKFFDFYQVIPSQLALNSFQIFCSIIILCHLFGIRLRISLFQALFMIKRLPKAMG